MEEKKGLIAEFKEFIAQGNVLDLAVAVVIGGAFTAIVTSVTNDLIMPLISIFTGGVDFSEMKFVIGTGDNAAAFTYGNLISAIIQFLIIAFVIFLIVKAANKAKSIGKKEEEPEPEAEAPKCPFCLEEVNEGATRCHHCAAELPKPAKAPAAE